MADHNICVCSITDSNKILRNSGHWRL